MRVIRSDSGVAHRLSSSARVLSAADSQVKAKRQRKKRLWHLHNWRAREFQGSPESPLEVGSRRISSRPRESLSGSPAARGQNRLNVNITRVLLTARAPFRRKHVARNPGQVMKVHASRWQYQLMGAAMAGFLGVATATQRRNRSRRFRSPRYPNCRPASIRKPSEIRGRTSTSISTMARRPAHN